jgi:tRNA 2-thiouridine synthesizing protein A
MAYGFLTVLPGIVAGPPRDTASVASGSEDQPGGNRVTPPPRPSGAPGPTPAPARTPPPALTIDALGKKCPIPIIMLAERIRDVPIGATVEVLANDPAAKTDVPAWCMMKSQEFVRTTALPDGWAFLVRRTY